MPVEDPSPLIVGEANADLKNRESQGDRVSLFGGETFSEVELAPTPEPRPARFETLGSEPTSAPQRARRMAVNAAKFFALGLLAYVMMFNFSVVRGSSMSPSIHDGDRILVDHLSYLFQGVRRGDIVVLRYPLDPSLDYIKRVIGLPGDQVRIESGKVYVNDEPLAEPYVLNVGEDSMHAEVLPGHFFVLGDNRPHSSDSREFGQVPREYLRGRVDLRVWPFERAGRVD